MRVGIPRVPSFYYYYPFYQAFFAELGAEVIVSGATSRRTIEQLHLCPTDEPCVAVKLAFPHTAELLNGQCDYICVPSLVSSPRGSFYCPKHIGLPFMIQNGLEGLEEGALLAPRIDWRDSPGDGLRDFAALASRFGASPRRAREAVRSAWHWQQCFQYLCASEGLTLPEALEKCCGIARPKRKRPYNPRACRNPDLRVGVASHSYLVYDYVGHNLVERLREHAAVLVPEMIHGEDLEKELSALGFSRELWCFEQYILGAALCWLRHGLVDCLILMGSFECGPEAILEVYLKKAAAERGVPFLLLTVDEQTGEAGLVTRLEAFLDTASAFHARRPAGRVNESPVNAAAGLPAARRNRPKMIGFPTMGKLGAALADIFSAGGIPCVAPPPLTKHTVELGAELAPEFICHPMTVTIGQMRQCLEEGADTLVMVAGKGRCRLGWYAEMQEILLHEAGYRFEMVPLHSPLPLRDRWRPFVETLARLTGGTPVRKMAAALLLAYYKVLTLEKGEEKLLLLRGREKVRGAGEKIFRALEEELHRSTGLGEVRRAWIEFLRRAGSLPLDPGARPLRVRLIGEIYAVLEGFVNNQLARYLGTMDGIRIEIERSISATGWLHHNVLHHPASLWRHYRVSRAAAPYLPEPVGGHGQESIGLTALAPREEVDGIVHLWPFTCMPEIIAQNILTRVAREKDIPVLTVIVNEQSGEAGLHTRLESFAHILQERRLRKEACLS